MERVEDQEVIQQVLGFTVRCESQSEHELLLKWFAERSLLSHIALQDTVWRGAAAYAFVLLPIWQQQWVAHNSTLNLPSRLTQFKLEPDSLLEQEIIIALLASPFDLAFPSTAELYSSVRIRRYIAQAGALTALAFDTDAAERPVDSWAYDEDLGFTVLPGVRLTEALRKATQPEVTGNLYSFSCYRATEYVIMLGIAQELDHCNKVLLAALQSQCEQRVIRSGQFHEVFLREFGSQESPVAPGYYVPGDRVWFRNPDEHSSDVAGFEGSWVLYLGGGLFTNFWKRNQPFTIEDKCLEIYHWRNGVVHNGSEEPRMDEVEVERRVDQTRSNAAEMALVLSQMMQLRAAKGIYGEGGCIDTTRESPRWVCPETADLIMPA